MFADIEQLTFRVGPEAVKYGDPWTKTCQGKIEHDRYLFLYGGMAEDFSINDVKEFISYIEPLANTWGWVGIRWNRRRPDGTLKLMEMKLGKEKEG